jgi:hypothetical protein
MIYAGKQGSLCGQCCFSLLIVSPKTVPTFVIQILAVFQEKIEKATAAIEAAKKSGEEFNKGDSDVAFLVCCCFKIKLHLPVCRSFCVYIHLPSVFFNRRAFCACWKWLL